MYSHFVTVGGGCEQMLIDELKENPHLFALEKRIKKVQGKVFFTVTSQHHPSGFDKNQHPYLRSAERLFVFGLYSSFSGSVSKRGINSRVWNAVEDVDWEECLKHMGWSLPQSNRKAVVHFRISPKLSGLNTRRLTSVADVAKCAGTCLRRQEIVFKGQQVILEVQLKNYELEVSLRISDNQITIGVPISSLGNRAYLPKPGIRATLAYCIVKTCLTEWKKNCPGKHWSSLTLLDPCAGLGTLLVEAAFVIPTSRLIAVDRDVEVLKGAKENFDAADIYVSTIQANSEQLPLSDSMVDLVVCDPPFGVRHKIDDQQNSEDSALNVGTIITFYRRLFKELSRVCRMDAAMAFLVPSVKHLESSALEAGWHVSTIFPVRHGRLNASICVLRRSRRGKKRALEN